MSHKTVTEYNVYRKGEQIEKIVVSSYQQCTDTNCNCIGAWGRVDDADADAIISSLKSEGFEYIETVKE